MIECSVRLLLFVCLIDNKFCLKQMRSVEPNPVAEQPKKIQVVKVNYGHQIRSCHFVSRNEHISSNWTHNTLSSPPAPSKWPLRSLGKEEEEKKTSTVFLVSTGKLYRCLYLKQDRRRKYNVTLSNLQILVFWIVQRCPRHSVHPGHTSCYGLELRAHALQHYVLLLGSVSTLLYIT